MHGPAALAAVAGLAAALGCGDHATAPETTREPLVAGEGRIAVPGGEVHYEIVGSGTAVPLLVLHGGPGVSSVYLSPLRGLADERPVVFYDQLGAGQSDRPDDPSLWTLERSLDELEAVRDALGLDEVLLYGHSWGASLAASYLLDREHRGVHAAVLAGPMLDTQMWLDDAKVLLAGLPEDVRETIERNEAAGTTSSEEYAAAAEAFYRQHLCRTDPWPPELQEAISTWNFDVYGTMWGPSEFHATGNLRDFSVVDRLPQLDVPVLYVSGRYDEVLPETLARFDSLTPRSRMVVIDDASHLAMLERPDEYLRVLRDFLRKQD